jgi:hypothetical protein
VWVIETRLYSSVNELGIVISLRLLNILLHILWVCICMCVCAWRESNLISNLKKSSPNILLSPTTNTSYNFIKGW